MSSPSGLPTNAVFGFTKDLLSLRERKPGYLLCAFDLPGPTFREKLYPDYKANRSPMPDDLRPQIAMIQELLEAMRIPQISKESFEADDILATVSVAASRRGLDVYVCTSDKDCRQLIDDRVQLYNLRKNKVIDRSVLMEEWSIRPDQVVDLQSLVGDPVDNVPGVPGIGLKTAAKLLREYDTLDNLLANVERITAKKLRQNLSECGEIVRKSRTLVRLATDVSLDMDWESWRLQAWDGPRLLELFQKWGFHRFADQVRAGNRPAAPRQATLFDGIDDEPVVAKGAPAKAKSPWEATYHLVDTPAKFASFLEECRKQPRFAIDLETTSLEPRRASIVGYAFSWKSGEGWYLPVRGPEGESVLDETTTLEQLKPILENPRIAKINQNIKYDQIVLRQQGVALAGVAGDSMVADYLLNAGERSHGMADLANRYLDHSVIPITALIGKNGKNQLCMDQVPTAKVAEYSGEDADVAWRLCGLLEPKLGGEGLGGLYQDLEIPLIEVLAELEFNGIRLDLSLLKCLSLEMAEQLVVIEKAIFELAGHQFNIASPKQLRHVLFDEMKLPTQRKTGVSGEASTDQETLERLAALGHPLPNKIVEHRKISKLKGTYVDALPSLVNPATERVHASFNQTVAATGRLSSSEPNLQNIPVRTEQGRHIRQAFLPQEGWTLLTADYSQIELRLLAHFSGDEAMRQAFADDRDIHAAVAAQIHGIPEMEVDADMRRAAKTVNFGVIYGMSAHGLAQRLGIPRDDASRFIDAYFARYPKVAEYQARLLENCRRSRYVSTILGRRREITGIRADSTYQQRNQPEREAINMEIQGSAADLIKKAMLQIHRRLRHASRWQARMLLQIHDELVFEVPPQELAEVARMVNEEMTAALHLEVPLKVDLAAGPNWLDLTELDLATLEAPAR